MITFIREILSDIFDLFYPNICLACSNKLLKGEETICLRCQLELPLTEHWTNPDNILMKRFSGRVKVECAASFLFFKKGETVQELIHQLKYKNQEQVGEYLGRLLGYKLIQPNSIFKDIDLVVPVPLHWKKLKTRGYNQCNSFAKGISATTGIPCSLTALIRHHENISQTKKKRFDRWQNVEEIFGVTNPAQLTGKHILLVDDVVTTGATSETCMQTILQVPGTRVSFVSLATALKS